MDKFRKILATTSIAAIAVFGVGTSTLQLNKLNETTQASDNVDFSSQVGNERASTYPYEYNGGNLVSIGYNSFTFDATFISSGSSDDFDAAKADIDELIAQINGTSADNDLLSNFAYNVKLNEGAAKTISWQENPELGSSYVELVEASDVPFTGDESRNVVSTAYVRITIHDPELIQGTKVENISLNTNDIFTTAIPEDNGIYVNLNSKSSYDGTTIDLEGQEGESTSGGYFIMPTTIYYPNSLTLGEVTKNEINFSFKLNGTYNETMDVLPVVTFEDDDSDYLGKERIMSTEEVTHNMETINSQTVTNYEYKITGTASTAGLFSNKLKANHLYNKVRVYFGLDIVNDIDGAFLIDGIDRERAVNPAGLDIKTSSLDPDFDSIQVNNTDQTSADFEMSFNASEVIKADDTSLTTSVENEYGTLDEDNLVVQISPQLASATEKGDATSGLIDLNVVDWRLNDDDLLTADFSATGLSPETEYNIYLDVDNTIGGGIVEVGSFITDPFDAYDFTDVSVTSQSYREAQVTVTMNDTVDFIYDLDNFKPTRIKAYENVEGYDGNDTSVFTEDKLLSMTYDGTTVENQYDFTIKGLNPTNNPIGETLTGVRFVYDDLGIIDPTSVSDSFEISSLPLEYVDIEETEVGVFDVIQTGQTISTINITLPGLNSAGYVTDTAAFPIEAYQEIEYGVDGNLQFAISPVASSSTKETTPDGKQILTSDEVFMNTATSFVLDLSDFSAVAESKLSGTSYEFEFQVGVKDSLGEWTWLNSDDHLYTTPLESATVEKLVVDSTTITQNEVNVSVDIKHNGTEDSLVAEFDPETDINFKAKTLENPFGEELNVEYVGTDVSNDVIDGDEIISTYEYKLGGLRAETSYSAISTSIQGSKFIDDASATFKTENKSMVGIMLTDDGTPTGNNAVEYVGSTYDSITFNVEAISGGNYKTLSTSDSKDLTIKVETRAYGEMEVENWTVEALDTTPLISDRASGVYNHEDEEIQGTYQFTLSGLSDPYWYWTKIDAVEIFDNTDVFGTSSIRTSVSDPLPWITAPRKDVQFSEGSIFQITTTEDDDIASTGFEFVFDLNFGGSYMDFDPATSSNYEVRLFAKEVDSMGNPKPYYTEISIDYIETISEKNDYTHKLKYAASGLKSQTTYQDIVLTIDKTPTQIVDGDPFNHMLEYNGTFTTSKLRSPVFADSFTVYEDDITNDSFKFTISVVDGSEYSTIKEEGYDVFDSNKAYLGYRNEAYQDIKLKTSFLQKANSQKTVNNRAVDYVNYQFEVTELEAGATYSNLYFDYNGEENSKTELPNKKVTIKSLPAPFDPNVNPVVFDYNSITSDSFEFSIYVTSEVGKGKYAGFSPDETVMLANHVQLDTELISVEKNAKEETTDSLDRYTYKVTNLYSSTTYQNFSIVINAYKGAFSTTNNDEEIFYTYSYAIPYATIRTTQDMTIVYTGLTAISALLLIVLLLILIYVLIIWYRNHVALGIIADPASIKTENVTYRVINAKRNKAFKKANLDEIVLYANEREVPSVTINRLDSHGEKTDDYQIVTRDVVGSGKNIVNLLAATKYDTFDISLDGGKTIEPLHTIDSKKSAKLMKMIMRDEKYEDAVKEYSKDKHFKQEFEKYQKEVGATALVLFNKYKNTSTTIRYEAIIPDGHPLLDNRDQMIESFQMYYQVDNQLYPFKMKYIGNEGSIYSWDLTELEPATAYVNIHFSFGKEKIIASLTNYGITRNEKNREVKLQDAELSAAPLKKTGKGKGIDLEKGFPIPSLKETVQYLGHNIAERMITISIQKHLQREEGKWIPEKKIGRKFNDYVSDWYEDVDSLQESYELHSFIINWQDSENRKQLNDVMELNKKAPAAKKPAAKKPASTKKKA